jgi:hypothetical protein
MTPECSLEESAAETQKHENEGRNIEYWREKLRRSHRRGISTFSNVFLIITMIKGE